jgi:hypothetical protein
MSNTYQNIELADSQHRIRFLSPCGTHSAKVPAEDLPVSTTFKPRTNREIPSNQGNLLLNPVDSRMNLSLLALAAFCAVLAPSVAQVTLVSSGAEGVRNNCPFPLPGVSPMSCLTPGTSVRAERICGSCQKKIATKSRFVSDAHSKL